MYCRVKLLFDGEKKEGKKRNITLAIINWRNYDVNKNKQKKPRAVITVVSNQTPFCTQTQTDGYELHTGTHVRRLCTVYYYTVFHQRRLSGFHTGV